jgi:anti-sigma regulatory factor (Ser/Thr protein kinase)
MTPPSAVHLTIRDSSNVGEARRTAVTVGRLNGMDETVAGAAAVVATELATNLCRYAPGGTLSIQWLPAADGDALEIVASDTGPGISDLSRCLSDGYSTGGTPGTGLGAVKRFSCEFDAYSTPGKGSVFISRISRIRATLHSSPRLRWGVFCRPVSGEVENGDSWRVSLDADRARFFVADGLGHGPTAAIASNAAGAVFARHPDHAPRQLMEVAHRELAGTRGAAAAVLQVDGASGSVSYAGIGNISSCLIDAGVHKGLISHNGTLGVATRKVQAFDYTWHPGALLVMHSDGIKTRWSLDDYPGLVTRHPSVIAATIARDFSRGNDDTTVLVARRERRA